MALVSADPAARQLPGEPGDTERGADGQVVHRVCVGAAPLRGARPARTQGCTPGTQGLGALEPCKVLAGKSSFKQLWHYPACA